MASIRARKDNGMLFLDFRYQGIRCREQTLLADTNVPVQIGSVVVESGDFVLADGSASIFISANKIDQVLETAELIVAKEAAMAKAIMAGTPIGQVMGGNYEHMLEK